MNEQEDYHHTVEGILEPLKNGVLVKNLQFGKEKVRKGVIILSDDATDRGIRPRWAEVHSIGSEIADIDVGDWILIEHGRWTRAVKVKNEKEEIILRLVDTKDILLATDQIPDDENSVIRDDIIQMSRAKTGTMDLENSIRNI